MEEKTLYVRITSAKSCVKKLTNIADQFDPLLKKYAHLLGYEEAYEELKNFIIMFLYKHNFSSLKSKNDATIVRYILICVRNYYKTLLKRKLKHVNELSLNEDVLIQSGIKSKDFVVDCLDALVLNDAIEELENPLQKKLFILSTLII